MRRLLNMTGVVIIVLMIIAVLPLTIPKLFGYKLFDVLSGSMEPAIPADSIIYVKPCTWDEISIGDIITFKLESNTDLVETHRVDDIDNDNKLITTKGDANESTDINKVDFNNVVGKVAFHIPHLAILSRYLHSYVGSAACIALFAAVLLMWMTADRLKRKENSQ